MPGEFNAAYDTLFWGYEAFRDCYAVTNDYQWYQAAQVLKQNTINAAVVTTISHYYKKDDNPDPFSYPGTQVVQVNNPNGFTASRQTTGDKANWLKVDVNAAPAGNFPSCEVQNFAIQTGFQSSSTVFVEYAHNATNFLMEVVLSTSSNAFDQTQLYSAEMLTDSTANSPKTKTFVPSDFIRWSNNWSIWYPTVAEDPIALYDGGTGTSSKQRKQITLGDNKPVIWEIQIDANTGFAGAVFIKTSNRLIRPPRIRWNVSGDPILLRLKDNSDNYWDCEVEDTGGWVNKLYKWSDFDWSIYNTEEEGDTDPDVEGNIKQIEIVATGDSTIQVWWITSGDEPEVLPAPCLVFKASLVDRAKDSHTFWCGTFKPTNSTLDALNYSPGVVPFTVNVLNNVIDAWRGIPLAGYQEPAFWREIGLEDRCSQALKFLKDAQDAYTYQNSNGTVGVFAPAYSWSYWDNADFLANGLNKFGWSAPDPNTEWAPYAYRALVSSARAWYLNRGDSLAKQITMRFLVYLDKDMIQRNSNAPITNFPALVDGTSRYSEPHSASLILRAAILANLAGGSPDVTFRLIKKCYEYIKSQYVPTGLMAGSFTAGQPTFVSGGNTYRENFGFWHYSIIEALSELALNANLLRMPTCATPL